MKKPKIAVVVSHPIQHFCPQYASYSKASEWNIKVFFASALGYQSYVDKDFGQSVSWQNLRLDQFEHQFLNDGKVLKTSRKLDAPDITSILEQYNPDAIITYGYSQKFQQKAVRWARSNGKRILYISDSEFAHNQSFVKKWLKISIYGPYLRKMDAFLTVGNSNEAYYTKFGIPFTKMIRTGFSIDVEQYAAKYQNRMNIRKATRAEYNIPDESIVVSVVGKLIPRKRQKDIVLALKALESQSEINFTALIIGSGPQLDELQQLATQLKRNRILFCGFVAPAQLPKFYAATDIYVHPSEMEPHSLAISEAIYMGCPAIISDQCGSYGPTDDVQVGRNGFVYSCGNVSELGQQLLLLAKEQSLKVSFSNQSHEIAIETQSLAHGGGLKTALIMLNLL